MGRVKPRYHGSGDGSGYGHLDTHRVWGMALKLLPTRVRTRVRPFKHVSRLYPTFRRPDSALKSKPMIGRRSGFGLQKNWQAKLRPYKT
ncbi:hypothetical protein MTR_8g010240 [Medicago truncatula]|uniref:Uncharacterized protein n=1 Tax=Medicago truncatula TaxID=3880 RepID=A0A072TWX3_MEDTR|nr:hypothetical protein MTR_8g010240 [Medicago truncatula]